MEFTSGALSARFLLLRVVVVLFGKKGSKGSEIKRTKLLLQTVDKLRHPKFCKIFRQKVKFV